MDGLLVGRAMMRRHLKAFIVIWGQVDVYARLHNVGMGVDVDERIGPPSSLAKSSTRSVHQKVRAANLAAPATFYIQSQSHHYLPILTLVAHTSEAVSHKFV